tara:strand:+ start:258 stop:410 length:153 start_codon:yes stop_codon:yes gene_type:complete
MNKHKIKEIFLFILNKKKQWLPSLIIIFIIFFILIFVGKINPIIFFYSSN